MSNIRWDILWSVIFSMIKVGALIIGVLITIFGWVIFSTWAFEGRPFIAFLALIFPFVSFLLSFIVYFQYTDKLMQEWMEKHYNDFEDYE